MARGSERWLPIPGYENIYEISDRHRVRRLARTTGHGRSQFQRRLGARLLSVFRTNGYLTAHLWLQPNGDRRSKMIYVEAMVANLFPDSPTLAPVAKRDGEIWRPVGGFEGLYEISSLGRVRSLARYVRGQKRRYARERLLAGNLMTSGYPKVDLAKGARVRTLSIHRLVATAFIPNPLGLPVVHHRDEDRMNNRAENLEWVSMASNVQDWFDRRRIVVSVATIEAIIAAHKTGRTAAEILAALPKKRKTSK